MKPEKWLKKYADDGKFEVTNCDGVEIVTYRIEIFGFAFRAQADYDKPDVLYGIRPLCAPEMKFFAKLIELARKGKGEKQ